MLDALVNALYSSSYVQYKLKLLLNETHAIAQQVKSYGDSSWFAHLYLSAAREYPNKELYNIDRV